MTTPTPTTPPTTPTQQRHDPILPTLAITFAVIGIVFSIVGAAFSGALVVGWLFGLGAVLMALIEIIRGPRGLSIAAIVLAALALLVAAAATAAVLANKATESYAQPPGRLDVVASTPTYAAPYVIPTTAYTPPPTYTPAPVYVAPTTTETTTTSYTPPPPPKPETWTYRVTGPPVVSTVTYSTGGSGNSAQDNNYRTPWRRTVEKDETSYSDGFAYVSAQNAGGGSISCSITDDATGRVISQNTSNGLYAIVTCSN